MAALQIVGFSGSSSQPSKTRALVQHIVSRAAQVHGGQGAVFDLVDLGPSLPLARRLDDLDAGAAEWARRFVTADLVVAASPIYKGSFAGIFKHFIDLLDPDSLRGRPVLIAASGGGDRHALAVEHQLRPIFGFFEAVSLPTAVYASDRDYDQGQPANPALLKRIEDAVAGFAPHVAHLAAARLRAAVA